MAIDSRDRRHEALNFLATPLRILPNPDGTIGQKDRAQLAKLYGGVIVTGQALAGLQPAATGSLGTSAFINLAGAQPAASGDVAAKAFIALAGVQPAATGALALKHLVVNLAGLQPSASGLLAVKLFVSLAGAQPAPSGALSFRFLYPSNQRLGAVLKRARIETTIKRGSRRCPT